MDSEAEKRDPFAPAKPRRPGEPNCNLLELADRRMYEMCFCYLNFLGHNFVSSLHMYVIKKTKTKTYKTKKTLRIT